MKWLFLVMILIACGITAALFYQARISFLPAAANRIVYRVWHPLTAVTTSHP